MCSKPTQTDWSHPNVRIGFSFDRCHADHLPSAETSQPNLASRVSPAPTNSTPRQHAHAAQGDRHDVTMRRRHGAIAQTYDQRTDRRAPCHVRTSGAALYRLQIAAQAALRPVLAFRGRDERVRSSKRKTHQSRVSPTPISSTQRSARNADRFGRCGVAAVRRCGGAVVRRCGASARTYGWDTLEPFITIKLGGRRYFAMSGHAGRLYVR